MRKLSVLVAALFLVASARAFARPILPLSLELDRGAMANGVAGTACIRVNATTCTPIGTVGPNGHFSVPGSALPVPSGTTPGAILPDGSTTTTSPTGLLSVIGTPRLGPFYDAVLYGGVVVNDGTDQKAHLAAAAAAVPVTGGTLLLPCGHINLGSTWTIPNTHLEIAGGPHDCTQLSSLSSFTTGDVLDITGAYSGLRNIGISHIGEQGAVARRSGYTVSLTGGYNWVENAQIRHCYICILMAPAGGWARVENVNLQYMADGTADPGSCGILVQNTGRGPDNWIQHVLIMSNFLAPRGVRFPSCAVKITNSGATMISESDFISNLSNLIIQPGPGQSVQSTKVSSTYLDSARASNVVISPNGSGYVFDTKFMNDWITNILTSNTSGIVLNGSGASPPTAPGVRSPITGTSWIGGSIYSTTSNGTHAPPTGSGVVCADASPVDTNISDTTIAGWGVGIDLAPGCSHFTATGNHIGAYSPFNVAPASKTNQIGIRTQGGAADWLLISGNTLYGNLTAPFANAGATGTHNLVVNNPGYNPVGMAKIRVTASPMTLAAGPTPMSYCISGGAGINVTDSTGAFTLATSASCVPVTPNARIILSYTSAPTINSVTQ